MFLSSPFADWRSVASSLLLAGMVASGTSSCSTLPEPTARAPRLRAYTSSNLEAPQQTGACTDWYDGASGEYITTTGDCSSGGSDYYYGGENHTGTGANAGGGYTGGTGGMGGGGGSSSNTSSTTSPTNVIISSSIHSDPKAECVLTKLQDNIRFKQLINNFQNSSRYNVSFNMGVLSGFTGECKWNSATSTAIITIDQESFKYQHAIWGAATFFHEAYHAQLQQFAIATFGTTNISNWPKQINDMTLQELISCVDKTATSNPSWTNATHQFMAYNNDIMAVGLRDFVQANYPQTYNQIGSEITKYNYLSLMGLEETSLYKTQILDQGKAQDYQKAINDFVTTERPDCL